MVTMNNTGVPFWTRTYYKALAWQKRKPVVLKRDEIYESQFNR